MSDVDLRLKPLNATELAKVLGRSRNWVYRQRKAGNIKPWFTTEGGRAYYTLANIEEQQRRRQAGAK